LDAETLFWVDKVNKQRYYTFIRLLRWLRTSKAYKDVNNHDKHPT
jgi:hypothetical protein